MDILKKEVLSQLVTVADYIRYINTVFSESDIFLGHGTACFWDEAVFAVAGALNIPFEKLDFCKDCVVTEAEAARLADIVQQRVVEHKPLAYLLNKIWFCGLEFYVDERVIIPRSPLAETINNQFAGVLKPERVQRVLDLCTGSGCIGLACVHALPHAEVDLVDICPDALEVAQINIENLDCLEVAVPMQSDLFSAIPSGVKYDLIVSNPPYVDVEDLEAMPAEFQHEPSLALAGGGADGLDIVRRILKEAAEYLTDHGVLLVEVGNSMLHIEQAFPECDFDWLQFENGGDGVFKLTKAQLLTYFATPKPNR